MESSLIKIRRWLCPFSFLYGIGVRTRNILFDWGILHSKSFDIPVISVGNITVGGTGKTPHIEYLIRILQNNFKVGVLSRGYKRKSKGFLLINDDTNVKLSGDEPYQIKQKFPVVYMAVDKNRCHGIEELSKEEIAPGLGVILLDDAFQHRYVKPGLNILLIDYNRLISHDKLLPAGQLREPINGRYRAHIVIITKCPSNIKPMDFRVLSKQIDLLSYQNLYFSTLKYKDMVPVFQETGLESRALDSLGKDEHIFLLTGIASPKQMQQDLETYTDHIETLTFGDHHNFTKANIKLLKKRFDNIQAAKKIIITTEKDAARLIDLPWMDEDLKKNIYYLPIEVEFLQNQQETFNQTIIGYVRKNKRNGILSKAKNAYQS